MTTTTPVIQPQEFTKDMFEGEQIKNLNDFLTLVKKGKPWIMPTKRLIHLNGNARRGAVVNKQINDRLKSNGLICEPEIENADYYGDVVIYDPRDKIPQPKTVTALPVSAFVGEYDGLISCGLEMPAVKVQTLMIMKDISQVPVLSNDKKNMHGVITWQSIAQYRGDLNLAKAADIQGPRSHVASSSDDFLDHVISIIDKEFLFYRAPDGRVDGIITASDLAQAFHSSAGIYIQLQEIETRLRILLDKSPIPRLQGRLTPNRRNATDFRGAIDMSFGEYIHALQDADVWKAAGISLDQKVCLDLLTEVKNVRNGVMHFSAGAGEVLDSEAPDSACIASALRSLRATPLKG